MKLSKENHVKNIYIKLELLDLYVITSTHRIKSNAYIPWNKEFFSKILIP